VNEITLHPNVYSSGQSKGLIHLLESVWVRNHIPGDGIMYIISGFANYNGGVRFFDVFKKHIESGGKVRALFSGSTSTRLTSKEVVTELLKVGAEVNIVNRKRLLHAKCYGAKYSTGEQLIVTSGNFTGPGMSQNVEMSVHLDNDTSIAANFSWERMIESIFRQKWDFYKPDLNNLTHPSWALLYDERASDITLDETEEVTLCLLLGHADTARINADPGDTAGLGTQYFWLSKDCYDFFPPLTIRNERGYKATYSCVINMNYIDLNEIDGACRVTFEAENNLDFRLGTAKLRYTKIAQPGDIAAISRVGENNYEMRIIKSGSGIFQSINQYAINYIGHQGKKYGFISNVEFGSLIGYRF
jgi:HKD family nuclease